MESSQGKSSANPETLQLSLCTSEADSVLYSRNKRLEDIVMNPIQRLVLLLGPQDSTLAIKKLLQDQFKLLWGQSQTQTASAQDLLETSKFNYKVQCYENLSVYKEKGEAIPTFFKE